MSRVVIVVGVKESLASCSIFAATAGSDKSLKTDPKTNGEELVSSDTDPGTSFRPGQAAYACKRPEDPRTGQHARHARLCAERRVHIPDAHLVRGREERSI